MSVCPSHAGIVSKWLNISNFFARLVDPPFWFLHAKRYGGIQMGTPYWGRWVQVGAWKNVPRLSTAIFTRVAILIVDLVFMRLPGQAVSWRHCVFILSVRVWFVCPFVHLSPHLATRYFENESTDCDANWHKWSTRQGHETINFEVRRSKLKVTQGQRQIWRPGADVNLDRLGWVAFLVLNYGQFVLGLHFWPVLRPRNSAAVIC